MLQYVLGTKNGIKFYIDSDINFCRWRSLSMSFPSLNKIYFFPPIILPQPHSNGRTNRVSQSTLREPGFLKVTESSYVRNRNSISEFQTLITGHIEKNNSCGISFPTCSSTYLCLWFLKHFLVPPACSFMDYPFPFCDSLVFFPELIHMTALRMGGS